MFRMSFRFIAFWSVAVQFAFLVGRAYARAGSSVASPHQTVPLPFGLDLWHLVKNGRYPGNAYPDPAGPSNRFREPPFGQPGVELVERDGQDDDRADDDSAVTLINAEDDDAIVDHFDDERAEQSPQGGAFSAGQTRPAHHRRGDHVQFVAGAVAGRGAAVVADRQQRGDARGQP